MKNTEFYRTAGARRGAFRLRPPRLAGINAI